MQKKSYLKIKIHHSNTLSASLTLKSLEVTQFPQDKNNELVFLIRFKSILKDGNVKNIAIIKTKPDLPTLS